MDEIIELKHGVVLSVLSEEQKANLSRELGITIGSDWFDPRFDYVFKRIFTADGEKSKKALISFLNAALKLTGENVISDLTVINPEIPVDDRRQKKSVFDIRVKFKNEEQAIIEMQFSVKGDFKKRAQFLISKAYASQPLSGEMYRALKKRYLIGITSFTLFPEEEVFLRFASDKSKREIINQILNKKEGISMAAQILEEISKDEREQTRLFDEWLYETDLLADKRYAVRTAVEAAEENKAVQIARNMKTLDIPFDKILKSTGVPLDVLQTL